MRIMLSAIILFSSSVTVCSQPLLQGADKPDWYSTPDGMVHGPEDQFRLMAANYSVARFTILSEVWKNNERENLLRSQAAEIAFGDSLLQLRTLQVDTLMDYTLQLKTQLIACGERITPLKTWAAIGKGAVIVVCLGVASVTYYIIRRSIIP